MPAATTLDEDQASALEHILNRVRDDPKGPAYFFLTGHPGAGKTRLAKAAIQALDSQYDIIVLTWNALSARNIVRYSRRQCIHEMCKNIAGTNGEVYQNRQKEADSLNECLLGN
ncbi:hypothetical protein FOZ60_011912 [Perkinsus olseni]|uniref:Zeta toxin domain-containing protein n=1 Tax=Perkinsus olseni TaxID=32597 RepID=A0A7J6NF46_PEROL|nr:hypothetical protein FOZ60_011912 [Perkinsus olseni]